MSEILLNIILYIDDNILNSIIAYAIYNEV